MVDRRKLIARITAALLIAPMLVQPRTATSAPTELFTSPAPAVNSPAPKASDIRAGDMSVSTQNGQLAFSLPIQAAPGRGVAPQLALTYSSKAPIYGGLAASWELSGIPWIREDTSRGRIRTHHPVVAIHQADSRAADGFVSSLAGGRPLVKVDVPWALPSDVYAEYRALQDTSWTRYQRLQSGQGWRVYHTDGSVMYFGDTTACPNIDEGYAPLTKVVDAFGNEMSITWYTDVLHECLPLRIEWGQNPAAGLASFARVELDWDRAPLCWNVHTGSHTDYRAGKKIVSGASMLMSITATAYPPGSPTSPEHTRVYTLGYDPTSDDCDRQHAPIRYLTSIQERAWRTGEPQVDLPAITFQYGSPQIDLTWEAGLTGWLGGDLLPHNLGWGYRRTDDRWPTVEGMLLDVDGDALPDRIFNTSTPGTNGTCSAAWQRNTGPTAPGGPVGFAPVEPLLTFPRLKWHGGQDPLTIDGSPTANTNENDELKEGCSLNGQVTAFINSNDNNPGVCHDDPPSSACVANPTQGEPAGPFCYPDPPDPNGGTECPLGEGGPATGDKFRTYLAYRWIDMDSDGLVDLVAGVHGDIDTYDIVQGNNVQSSADPNPGSPRPAEPLLFGAWPAPCPMVDRCQDLSGCMDGAIDYTTNPPTIDWDEVNTCQGNAPAFECEKVMAAKGPNYDPNGGTPPPAVLGGRGAYQRCRGLYPWMIYKNLGQGSFATTATIKYMPAPLESNSGDSNIIGAAIVGERKGVYDFDGDGFLDVVVRDDETWFWWQVWLGDGTGGVEPTKYLIPTRIGTSNGGNLIAGVGTSHGAFSKSSEGLVDLNGDGQSDHWIALGDIFTTPDLNANIAYHDGIDYWTPTSAPGEVDTPFGAFAYAVKPGDDACYQVTTEDATHHILDATTGALNRVVDVDLDGRSDVVQRTIGTSCEDTAATKVFFNVGGQFIAQVSGPQIDYPGTAAGIERKTRAGDDIISTALTWELESDLIDLDGDGVPEATNFDENNVIHRFQRAPGELAPRLMSAMDNGRGAHTEIVYASMHDTSAVEQHPDETWPDGRPKASPANQWVVKQLRVVDDLAQTDATTSYSYKNPRHGADDTGRYAFRGFEEVTTTAPSLATTVHRYGYTPDWSGRLVATIVRPAPAEQTITDEVRSIDATTWEERSLFGGTVTTYHATVSDHFTCKNGQRETDPNSALDCTQTPSARTRTTTTYTKKVWAGGEDMLWEPTEVLLSRTTTPVDGDRRTLTTTHLEAGSTSYKVRRLETTREHRTGGSFVVFGKSATTWDATYRVPLEDKIWFSDAPTCTKNDDYCAVTARDYDMTTGNLLARWKPEQHSASSTKTTYTYDARKLFVATEVNELGHQRDYLWEYGTGTKLQTDGPNQRTCVTGVGNCPPPDATYPLKEQERIVIDGLGRMLERWDTFSQEGGLFVSHKVETASYVDAVVGGAPTSVTSKVLRKLNTTLWTEQRTDLDGHGRPIKETVFVQGSAPSDQITTFKYRNDGTLEEVKVPDPTQNDASQVTYRYGFDSLGRAISMRRPDDVDEPDQSGVDIVYDGVQQTTSEYVGEAGGNAAVTTTKTDSFGRLTEVYERLTTNPETWAPTRYDYGPDNNVTFVTDAESVATALVHDFAGRRTQITRAGRTWTYVYDKNGNVTSEEVPCTPYPACAPNHVSTMVYDDLDRPLSKTIAPRDLSPADQQLFGGRTETFTWDIAGNMKGYLRNWQSFAPNAQAGTLIRTMWVNSQGQQWQNNQRLDIDDLPVLDRGTYRTFLPFGGLAETRYYDQIGAAPGTNQWSLTQHQYDARALPMQIVFNDINSGNPPQTLAVQTRNVAGLVTKRRTDTTQAVSFVESNWTYDKLGRVTSQLVQKGPGLGTTVVRQDLEYFGNDDPERLHHYLETTQRTFDHAFDHRHQLAGVTETTSPGYFDASYQYGTAGRFTRATEASVLMGSLPPGSDVKPRDVTYQYAGVDPEQVTALVHASGPLQGTAFAGYAYDAAGNQTWRCYGSATPPCAGESMDYVYDGKDQLRRATKKQNGIVVGSEEYWYDHNGQRMAIVKRDAAGERVPPVVDLAACGAFTDRVTQAATA